MPIVRPYPIGEISPQPIPNVAPNVPAAGDINLFGGNQARDLQLAGQNLGQASDTLFALYQRHAQEANDTRVQDLNNRFLDGNREILSTGPDAYYKRTGADAITTAGATTETVKAYGEQIYGEASNDYQRQKLRPILDAHIAASTDGIVRHVSGQQAVYARGVAANAIETSRAEAKADPANMANAVMRAEGAARALHAGQPPEAIETGVRAAGGSVIAGVIGDRLARNDPMGVKLFRQYADRLDARDRRTLGAAADTLSNTLAATAWVRDRSATLRTPAPTGDAALDAVNGATASATEPPPVVSSAGMLLDQDGVVGARERLAEIDERRLALTALNQQEFAANPARLRANQAAIDTDTARSRAAVKADIDTVYAGLRRHLTTGGPNGGPAVTSPPATIMSRLTDAQQDAVSAQVNGAIEGRRSRTDPQTWYAIQQGMTANDANERARWASKNLVPFMGRLSEEDFAALEKLQAAVRSNDGGAEQSHQQIIARMANDTLRRAGIDPTPRRDAPPDSDAAQAAMFHRALQDELSAAESRGRKPTEAEAYGIVEGLKDTGIRSGWLKVADRLPNSTTASDAYDDAFHRPGVQLAQGGAEEDRRDKLPPDLSSSPEAAPGGNRNRTADQKAQDRLTSHELDQIGFERATSEWMTGFRPDAAPRELPEAIADHLSPEHKEKIQAIIGAGADTRTDPELFKELFLGLTSDDRETRLKYAREPLYLYRSQLSAKDFGNLFSIQRHISATDGIPVEGVGYPLGTLDDHAELAAELLLAGPAGTALVASSGRLAIFLARQAARASRWALDKFRGKDEPPPAKDVLATEAAEPSGVGGGAAKAAATALSTSGRAEVTPQREVDTELPVPETMTRVSEQSGKVTFKKSNPSVQEIAGGKAFADLGYEVVHQLSASERGIKGVPTADLHVKGIGEVEIYSPERTTGVLKILRTLEHKQRQGRAILVQTELPVETMQSIAARLWGKPHVDKIDTLFFQSPGGILHPFNRPVQPSK